MGIGVSILSVFKNSVQQNTNKQTNNLIELSEKKRRKLFTVYCMCFVY